MDDQTGWPDVTCLTPLDLPSVRQSLDFTCGAACFDSMFKYYRGSSPGEIHFARELGTIDLGHTPPENIVTLARTYGFLSQMKENAGLNDLREALERRCVVFVILVGRRCRPLQSGKTPRYKLCHVDGSLARPRVCRQSARDRGLHSELEAKGSTHDLGDIGYAGIENFDGAVITILRFMIHRGTVLKLGRHQNFFKPSRGTLQTEHWMEANLLV